MDWTTWRTRFSSSEPLAKQNRNRCFASRLICLLGFILSPSSPCQLPGSLLGKPALIFACQDLSGYRGGGLHNQMAHFAFELGQHQIVVLLGCLSRFDCDLLSSSNGLSRFLFPQPCGRVSGL